ncbi:MAG: hypothetical protein RR053_03780 [Evtepia sp.]
MKTKWMVPILLLILLCGCGDKEVQADGTARLIATDSVFVKACGQVSPDKMVITVAKTNEESRKALEKGDTDMAVLSTKDAVELFQKSGEIQALGVISDAEADQKCLVVRSEFVKENAPLVDELLQLCAQAAGQEWSLSVGWDMIAKVQSDCESRFEQDPEGGAAVPDDGFYYFAANPIAS